MTGSSPTKLILLRIELFCMKVVCWHVDSMITVNETDFWSNGVKKGKSVMSMSTVSVAVNVLILPCLCDNDSNLSVL